MRPNIGKTHILRERATKKDDGSYTSNAWAGPVTQTGSWTMCSGQWTIPTVSKPSEAQGTEGGWNSSSWVGIDGFNSNEVSSNDVVQAGIEQRVNAQGVASYSSWYEWYAPPQPNSPPCIYETPMPGIPAAPGGAVSCAVQYVGTTAATITFANVTTGSHFSITIAPPPGANFKGNTVAWIIEAPDHGEPTSSLPKFTPVAFTSAVACGPNNKSTNPTTSDTVNIKNAQGKILTSTTMGSDTVTITFIG